MHLIYRKSKELHEEFYERMFHISLKSEKQWKNN